RHAAPDHRPGERRELPRGDGSIGLDSAMASSWSTDEAAVAGQSTGERGAPLRGGGRDDAVAVGRLHGRCAQDAATDWVIGIAGAAAAVCELGAVGAAACGGTTRTGIG